MLTSLNLIFFIFPAQTTAKNKNETKNIKIRKVLGRRLHSTGLDIKRKKYMHNNRECFKFPEILKFNLCKELMLCK